MPSRIALLFALLVALQAYGVNISVIPEAALHGERGLRVTLTDVTDAFIEDASPDSESRYRFRFFANFDDLAIEDDSVFTITVAISQVDRDMFALLVSRTAGQLQLQALLDPLFAAVGGTTASIPPGWHEYEFDFQAGEGDGHFRGLIDGQLEIDLTGLNTTVDIIKDAKGTVAQRVNALRIGAFNLPSDNLVSGSYDLDSFDSSAGDDLNTPPETTGIANFDLTADFSTTIDLTTIFTDEEDAPTELDHEVVVNTRVDLLQTSIDPVTRILTLTTAPNMGGQAIITVRATDSGNLSAESTFTVTVNGPPVAIGIDNINVLVDSAPTVIDLFAAFDDPESLDTLLVFSTPSIQNPALFSSIDIDQPAGTLTLAYVPGATGQSTITVRATDPRNQSTDTTFTVTVAETINTPPVALGIDDITLPEGADPTVIDLFAAFDDAESADTELVFSIPDVQNPALFSSTDIDDTAGTLTLDYAPGATGQSDVTVRATDPGGQSTDTTFAVTITDTVNTPPVALGINDITVDEDAGPTVIDLFAAFDDAESPDTELVFSTPSVEDPTLFFSLDIDQTAGTLTITYAPDTDGQSTITVRATDPGNQSTETIFTITINDGDEPGEPTGCFNAASPGNAPRNPNPADIALILITAALLIIPCRPNSLPRP